MKNLSSDQKQKLFILMGFVGILVIAGFFALRPKGDDAANAAPIAATPPSTNAGAAPVVPASAPATSTPARSTTLQPTPTAAKVVVSIPSIPAPKRASLIPSRPDPFAPIFWPTPPPEQSPTPVPPAVVIPPPPSVNLPSPAPEGAPPSTVLVGLPNPRISRYSPLPGPRWVVPASGGGGGGSLSSRAADKRLSGVIIGDSVRAILEIQQGAAGGSAGEGTGAEGAGGASQVITRVVQPGDEVDGIKILRINREFENGRPVTRMYILEGDQERYVDLRASPTPPTAGTGSEGFDSGGSGSGRSGFGRGSFGGSGSSSGFGGGGIRPTFP